MRKQFFLSAALFWTGVILFFCLENAQNIPQIAIPFVDKMVHVVFHFIFTILWFLYFKKKFSSPNMTRLLSIAWMSSLFFGIAIELIQQYVTTTRNADIIDVLANSIGATFAVLLLLKLNTYNKIIDKI